MYAQSVYADIPVKRNAKNRDKKNKNLQSKLSVGKALDGSPLSLQDVKSLEKEVNQV